jgi:hypothetical protein
MYEGSSLSFYFKQATAAVVVIVYIMCVYSTQMQCDVMEKGNSFIPLSGFIPNPIS